MRLKQPPQVPPRTIKFEDCIIKVGDKVIKCNPQEVEISIGKVTIVQFHCTKKSLIDIIKDCKDDESIGFQVQGNKLMLIRDKKNVQ